MDSTIVLYLISIMAVVALSAASSITKDGFSMNIFLTAFSIGIGILVWVPLVPVYLIVLPIIIIVGRFFSARGTPTEGGI